MLLIITSTGDLLLVVLTSMTLNDFKPLGLVISFAIFGGKKGELQ